MERSTVRAIGASHTQRRGIAVATHLRWLLVCAPLLLGAAAAPSSLEAIDKAFVCPEATGSDAQRMASLRRFTEDYAALRPNATFGDMIAYRRVLFAKHGCAKTLGHVEASERAVAAGDVEAQAWLPIANRDGASLAMSTNHVSAILDPRAPDEKVVETYGRLSLNQSALTNATRVRYDVVVSHSAYYCRTRRYALLDNSYSLAGKRVLVDRGEVVGHMPDGRPLYAIADVPAGSMNEAAWRWACEVGAGSPA